MAIPVIVSEAGGLKELVALNGRAGFVLTPGVPAPLAGDLEASVRTLSSVRDEMGMAGRRTCEQLCDVRICRAAFSSMRARCT